MQEVIKVKEVKQVEKINKFRVRLNSPKFSTIVVNNKWDKNHLRKQIKESK